MLQDAEKARDALALSLQLRVGANSLIKVLGRDLMQDALESHGLLHTLNTEN